MFGLKHGIEKSRYSNYSVVGSVLLSETLDNCYFCFGHKLKLLDILLIESLVMI